MATFSYNPSYIYEEEITYRTQIIVMEDGTEVRNSYGTPRRIFTLNYDRVTETIKDNIIAFFTARTGRYEAFDWVNPNDSVTYSVRFINEALEVEEIANEIWNIGLKFIEVI